ncbi:hypothetical protein AB0878_24030 [Amycolatopsis sp. NPDC047767]|uniref:hypothetical protein n=1 Tax=Amycolatopsis sp. NPDC047767 TaxID=3156765 RepID=UPI003454CC59
MFDHRRISWDGRDVRILTRVALRELLRGPAEFTALVDASAVLSLAFDEEESMRFIEKVLAELSAELTTAEQ